MKLLLDQNLSRRLVGALEVFWPGSSHLCQHQLERATDQEIWHFAKREAFCIISKDSDFLNIATLYGHPPKIIIIDKGNASTALILECLQQNQLTINRFASNNQESVLILS